MAPTKRELNGGIVHAQRSAARPGRKNNRTPATNTTEHSTATSSRRKEGTAGFASERSNISDCLLNLHLLLLNCKESKVNCDDRLETMQPDIMSIQGHEP